MKQKKELINKELDLIYENIIKKAKFDSKGIFWISDYDQTTLSLKFSENIYSGVSGILLFLIEYYNYKKKLEILEIIKKCTAWLEYYCLNHETTNFSFYTGRVGTIYALLRAKTIIEKKEQVESILSQLNNLNFNNYSKDSCFDFLNGISGTIIGLIHIYDITKEPFIKKKIIDGTYLLIKFLNVREHGFFWSKTDKMIQPLCGFSHGTSGTSLAFLELGRYFNNSFLLKIAEKAINFEDCFFNKNENNWPDFRKGYYNQADENKFTAEYLKGNFDFFKERSYMNAWCHGAPGIGLVRLRAYKIFNNFNYLEKINSIATNLSNDIKKIDHSYYHSFTLCHGFLGNYSLLFEESVLNNNKKNLDFFINGCLISINARKFNGFHKSGLINQKDENLSMFLGIAGIGYSYLKVLSKKCSFSPLLPILNSHSNEDMNEFNVRKAVYENCKKRFPLTTGYLNSFSSKWNFSFDDLTSVRLNQNLENYIRLNSKRNNFYELELLKNKKESNIVSYAYLKVKKRVNILRLIKAIHNNFNSSSIYINDDVEILQTNKKYIILYSDTTEYKLLEIDSLIAKFLIHLRSEKICKFSHVNFKQKKDIELLKFLVEKTIIMIENES